MEENQLIELNKKRSFDLLITSTFNFLRQEFKFIFKALLIYTLPVLLIIGILSGINQYKSISSIFSSNLMSMYSDMFTIELFLTYPFMLLAYFLMVLIVYSYMKEYNEGGPQVTLERLNPRMKQYLGKFILALILVTAAVIAGSLLIVPGIYIAVTAGLIFPIIIFEDATVVDAFKKCFYLIKGFWWKTLGAALLLSLIVYVVSAIFSIPISIIIGIEALHSAMGQESSEPSLAVMIIFGIFASLSYLFTAIPLVFYALQYFNLVERKEAASLINKIENYGERGNDQIGDLST